MLRKFGLSLVFAAGLIVSAPAVAQPAKEKPTAEQALSPIKLGIIQEATIYGMPILGMYARMQKEALDPVTRLAPLNAFYHYRNLATPTVAPFRAPNNDTLYSTAWLDLRGGPVLLDVPDTKGRYYTVHVMDLTSDTIENIGQRKHGTSAGRFAFVGPGYDGPIPADVKVVVRSQTPFVGLLMRLLVDGPNDVKAVNRLQDGFRISTVGPVPADPPRMLVMDTPSARFAALDAILRTMPVRAGEAATLERFGHVGLGPASPGVRLIPDEREIAEGERLALPGISAVGLVTGKFEKGWRVVREGLGAYGMDFLQRASVWDGGPLANVVEESFYPSALMDSSGKMLDGRNAYRLHFRKEELPPVNAFWSLTMYRMDNGYLVSNPIGRYSIGDRSRGIVFGKDGGLTISIQKDRPATGNWLPAPEGPFYMVLRLYGPKQSALSGAWNPPAIERIAD